MCPAIFEPVEQPKDSIMIWSGFLSDIPLRWQLCDGTNSTPNLLDKFVRSVNTNTTDPGTLGGENTHVLTVPEMAAHSHGLTESTHTHDFPVQLAQFSGGAANKVANRDQGGSNNPVSTSDALNGVSVGNAGSGAAHDNIPVFFEVAFIMRVS